MQLFQINSPDGELILTAPLETIQKVWSLLPEDVARICSGTLRLEGVVTYYDEKHLYWPRIKIRRMPLEIPSEGSTDFPEERCCCRARVLPQGVIFIKTPDGISHRRGVPCETTGTILSLMKGGNSNGP